MAWTNFDRCFLRNDSLISQAANTNIYGMAASKNTLAANTDGWFEFVVPDVTSTARYFIGFVDTLASLSLFGDIDYGVYYNSNKSLYYYEAGVGNAVIKTTPKVGDVIKVERIGNTINYKINNSIVRTVTVSGLGSKVLKLKASFNSSPARLINVGCSFTNLNNQNFSGYVDPKVIIRHVSNFGSSDGYSKATPRISFTNTYTWQPSGVNTQTVGSLSAGTITLTVADSLLNRSTYNYNVGYRVDWTNLNRCIYRNDSLITSGANANTYGTANSKNTLESGQNGWFEYTIHNLSGNAYFFGLVDKFNSIPNSAEEMLAGFRFATGILYYVESGSNTALFYSAKEGDRLRIERTGNSFIYKINGVTIRTITNSSFASKALKLNILLLNTNYMANVGCSFYNKSNSTFDNYVLLNPVIKHNSSSSSSDGSIKPNPEVPFANTYTWQPSGATTNSISSLPVGVYTVTVKDGLNNQSVHKLKLGYKVEWTNVSQAKFRNDSLFTTSTNSNVIGSAVSKNTLSSNTSGWVEYRVIRLNNYRYYFGFADSIHPQNYTPIDIDYGFYYTGNILYSYENNTSTVETYHLKIGDLLSVQRSNDTIYYRVNDYIVKWLYVPNVSKKILKIKSALYHTDALIDVGCSFVKSDSTYFANYVELIPEINHAGSTTLFNGSVKVTPRISAGNTYSWTSNGSNSNTINNLKSGRYTVRTSDNSGNSSYGNYNVGYKVNWTSLFNANIGGDTLRSTVTTTSSACSKDTLKAGQNGWVEYVYSESSAKSFRFGFLDVPSGTQSAHTDIDFGIYYNGAGIFYYQENSTNTVLSYNARKGDVFRIERKGDTILYSYNGLLARTIISAGLSSKSLLLKSVLYNKAKLAKLGASFSYCKFSVTSSSSQTITCASPTVLLSGSTNMSSPSYTWSAGGTSPNSFTTAVSAPGIYTLTVSNSTGCMAASTVAVVGSTVAPSVTIESTSSTPTLGLNAYWPFNGNANDVSGNANNGTVTDATLTNDRFGSPNKAYYFNGTTSRIDVPNSSTVDMPDGQDYSISFWMKAKPGNVDATPISKNQYGAWSGYMFFANSTNGGYCNTPDHGSFYVAAGGGGDVCSNNAIYNDTTNWYFITGQYQASTNQAFMYVNSVLQTDIGSASGATSNTKQLSFGAYNDAAGFGYFKGALDDIRFYNRLLTQSEINSLFNETSALTTPTISCENPIINLKVNTSEPNVTYSWTPGGSSPTNSVTSVSSGGIYSVTVTNTLTGCVATNTIQIYAPFAVCPTIQNYENDSIQGSVNLLIVGEHAPYKVEWNGQKVPSVSILLNALSSYSTSLSIDTVQFKHYADSISSKTSYSNLTPGFYPFKIFDSIGDSIAGMACVGSKINWDIKAGVVSQDDKISPRVVNNVNYYYASAQKITQEGSFSLGSNYAVSTNYIDSKFNNHIEFTNPDSKQIIYAGLTLRDTNIITLNSTKTYFEFTGASTYNIYFLDSVIYTGGNASGDVFSIDNDIETGELSYYKNGVKLVSRTFDRLNPDQGLLFKAVCGSAGSRVANIVSINASAYSSNYVIGNVIDVTCFSPNSGAIDVYPYVQGSVYNSPISYELYKVTTSGNILVNTINGPFTPFAHSLFQNLSAGKYEVKYTGLAYFIGFPVFSISQVTFSSFFEIAYKPDWVNDVNVSIGVDRSLQKNGGAIYDWDAGASSINTLLAANTGWVEWTASADQNINAMGFSYADNDVTINTIDYSVGYIRINLGIFGIWNLYVKTNNSTMITAIGLPGNILRSYNVNDKIRLEKDASQIITMYLNGNPIEQFSSSVSGPMIIDASLKFLNGKISKPRCSFGCPITPVKNYAVLKSFVDGQYYKLDGNHLNFTVDGEYTLNRLKFKVYDNKRNVVISDSYNANLLNIVNLKIGDNRYYLDCNSLAIGYYTLEVTNEKNEKLHLRFKR